MRKTATGLSIGLCGLILVVPGVAHKLRGPRLCPHRSTRSTSAVATHA